MSKYIKYIKYIFTVIVCFPVNLMLMILKPTASYIMMQFHISIDTFKALRGDLLGKEKLT